MSAANKGLRTAASLVGLSVCRLTCRTKASIITSISSTTTDVFGAIRRFMRLSHAVVVTPGGVGTCLELLFTWQLIQVSTFLLDRSFARGRWHNNMGWFKSLPARDEVDVSTGHWTFDLFESIEDVIKILHPDILAFGYGRVNSAVISVRQPVPLKPTGTPQKGGPKKSAPKQSQDKK